jgi:hypothetical protein
MFLHFSAALKKIESGSSRFDARRPRLRRADVFPDLPASRDYSHATVIKGRALQSDSGSAEVDPLLAEMGHVFGTVQFVQKVKPFKPPPRIKSGTGSSSSPRVAGRTEVRA